MPNYYFDKFPNTVYSNTTVTNIMRRIGLSEAIKKTPEFFYKMKMPEGLKERILADSYYDDQELAWLIYLSNSIIDPYYGWHLENTEFNDFIVNKYGSLEEAQQLVKFYRVKWADDDSEISTSFHDNTLDGDLRKYWSPVFDQNARIVSYKRAHNDWMVNTNQLWTYTVADGSDFETGERVKVKLQSNNYILGQAEVVIASNTTVTVQHIQLESSNAAQYVYGLTSGANSNITATEVVYVNIPTDEQVYWEPVYMYDYEREKNEANRDIRLLLDTAAPQITNQIEKALKK